MGHQGHQRQRLKGPLLGYCPCLLPVQSPGEVLGNQTEAPQALWVLRRQRQREVWASSKVGLAAMIPASPDHSSSPFPHPLDSALTGHAFQAQFLLLSL